ncbi:MAG: hypothetical protein MZV64_25645 [Ignavibacteriales bacterium]|nr:hypothetical protein [Ignavibacteriales bacterium]
MLLPMYFLIGIWGGPSKRICSYQILPLHFIWKRTHSLANYRIIFQYDRNSS